MKFPTDKQVDEADIVQLRRWHMHLPVPGFSGIPEGVEWVDQARAEQRILNRIEERIKELGGWSPLAMRSAQWST